MNDRTLALYYNCDIEFFTDNDEIVEIFNEKRKYWGLRALAIIGIIILKDNN